MVVEYIKENNYIEDVPIDVSIWEYYLVEYRSLVMVLWKLYILF